MELPTRYLTSVTDARAHDCGRIVEQDRALGGYRRSV
jgi:hypothetical protein